MLPIPYCSKPRIATSLRFHVTPRSPLLEVTLAMWGKSNSHEVKFYTTAHPMDADRRTGSSELVV
jgi:hypothetical protein